MMRNTPRTFVGTVVFRLAEPPPGDGAGIGDQVGRLSGVSSCSLDEAAGLLVVTAHEPVERADVVSLLQRLGCRVAR